MEFYAFGGVLGLMACAFGWAACRDWSLWRRPRWCWLCVVSGLLSLTALTGGACARGPANESSWWLVLALALAGGLVWSARMVIAGVVFTKDDTRTKEAFEAKCRSKGLPAAILLDNTGVLAQLLRDHPQGWVLRIAAGKMSSIENDLAEIKRALAAPPDPEAGEPPAPGEEEPPDTLSLV